MSRIAAAVLLLLSLSSPSRADSLEIVKGDVVLRTGAGEQSLTQSHDISKAVSSPDGAWIAYVRHFPPTKEEEEALPDGRSELWLVDRTGTNRRRLLTGTANGEVERTTAEINDILFGLAGDRIYILTTAWATSNAIHEIRLSDGAERFIVAGNDLALVTTGQQRGFLLVKQHRYRDQGGSYDDIWLVTPDGKTVRRVADSMEKARRKMP